MTEFDEAYAGLTKGLEVLMNVAKAQVEKADAAGYSSEQLEEVRESLNQVDELTVQAPEALAKAFEAMSKPR